MARKAGTAELRCDGVNSASFVKLLGKKRPHYVLLGTWGDILRPPVLHTPDVRFVNCHPSLLPAHRGTNPYASVIRSGEHQTGVTFHLVNEQIDAGPVLLQATVPVLPDDTGGALRQRCAERARALVPELLARLSDPTKLETSDQAAMGKSSYFPHLRAHDGLIRWDQGAKDIRNHIRGVQPWLQAYTSVATRVGTLKLGVTRSAVRPVTQPELAHGTVTSIDDDAIWVSTGSDQEVGLKNVRAYISTLPLPADASRLLCSRLIRAGSRLTT